MTTEDINDAGPITTEWLAGEGFVPVPSDMGPRYDDHYEWNQRFRIWKFSATGHWLFNDADWIELRTRGDVRLLVELVRRAIEAPEEPPIIDNAQAAAQAAKDGRPFRMSKRLEEEFSAFVEMQAARGVYP